MPNSPTLLWFRQDLRLQDNPALCAAIARGGPVVPVYILDDQSEGRWVPGAASRWWLHHSLAALDAALRERGSRLVLARGEAVTELLAIARRTGAGAVVWNRRYEPAGAVRDIRARKDLAAAGLEVETFNGSLLHEPAEIANKQGGPFQVFTAYWRHCLTLPVEASRRLGPKEFFPPGSWPASAELGDLKLLPTRGWDAGFYETWKPGEASAAKALRKFVGEPMEAYVDRRNLPDVEGTSRLSAHLHFGELSPRQVWGAVQATARESGVFPPSKGAAVFLSEVGWREFAHHLLHHFPHTPEKPLREKFAAFAWAADPGGKKLRAWQLGATGYPIVDAGMRQLWHTGWMHNRVRMIVASFLVKHLRLSWTLGAEWFWDTLVDADLANNTLGWQWSAGCGADAAPYFRIFAPVLQGQKFDAAGNYVRRWVPELAQMPAKFIHAPWEAPEDVLVAAGVRLGDNYPRPVVDHATARVAALAAFRQLRPGARP